jgi:cytochrome c peroxidase
LPARTLAILRVLLFVSLAPRAALATPAVLQFEVVRASRARLQAPAGLAVPRSRLSQAASALRPPSAPFDLPLGFPPIPWPEDNPYSPARADLGRILFFDGRLSTNGAVSCAFCHEPEHAFASSTTVARGVNGKPGTRHAPTLINCAWGKSYFWDGRAPTLESQIVEPITNPDEMGMTVQEVVRTIRGIGGYAPLFTAAFGDDTIDFDRIAKAIATFERTIVSGNSAYDRYRAGDRSALTKQQKDGLDFFNKKGECAECHNGPNFTNEKFVNLGIGTDRPNPDRGREAITSKRRDFGRFKVPGLRDLARRAPYMHDGSLKTLSQVLDIYARGGVPNPHLDTRLAPFYLDEQTRRDLLAFLDSLNGEGWQKITPPAGFPQ